MIIYLETEENKEKAIEEDIEPRVDLNSDLNILEEIEIVLEIGSKVQYVDSP